MPNPAVKQFWPPCPECGSHRTTMLWGKYYCTRCQVAIEKKQEEPTTPQE